MKDKFLLRRMLASAGALVLTVSLLLTSVSAAAAGTYTDLAQTLQMHDAAFGQSDECTAIIQKAVGKRDIRALIIHYFLHNADYYYQNGLNPDFPYFNADKYLKENPDVAMETAGSREGALEHYLTVGALEGRSSCTRFDPIIAMSVLPEAGILTPEGLEAAWIQAMGIDSTEDYILTVSPAEKYTATMRANRTATTPAGTKTAAANEDDPAPSPVVDKQTYTLMVYLCGSDLESKANSNEATKALVKIIMGAYDEENVNVVLVAGGADTWKNNYFDELLSVTPGQPNKSAMFSVNKEGVKMYVEEMIAQFDDVNTPDELYEKVKNTENWPDYKKIAACFINEEVLQLIGEVGTNQMGDPDTLTALLKTAASDFPADQYGLSLWNHGGGSVEGVCFSDYKPNGTADPLEIPEIKAAIQSAGFGSTASESENKLGLLVFDACLMAGAETAAYLTDCFDMMYASEEKTYGDIDYYNAINIANEKAGDQYLSYWLAIEIVEDRLANYTGGHNMLATGALFESGKAEDSMVKLNAVAQELNKLTANADTAQTVYRAFKNARLKCEQIGSSTSAFASKDYVDMRNFLDMLEKELKGAGILSTNTALSKAIETAKAAADEATYATVFNYCGQKVFYNLQDSDDVWYNQEFWQQLKGKDLVLSGASVYVPYYGAEDGDGLKAFEKNFADTLPVKDYVEFIKKFSSDYLNSEAEKERIEKLTDALRWSSEDETAVTGYAEMLDMSLDDSAGGKVLSIRVKDYENGEAISDYSSGDAFVDLCETMDTMLVYITRRAQAIYATNHIQVTDDVACINVVVGSKTVSYENLNGLQSAVNIFTDQFDTVDMRVVSSGEAQSYDFVFPSDLEGYTQKRDMVAQLLGTDADADNCLTVKGTAKLSETETVAAYHLFEYDSESEAYIYRGSTQLLPGENNKFVVGPTLETEAITFYHQMIDGSKNRLVYAEELEWEDTAGNLNSILSLCGGKEYQTGGDAIVISSIPLVSFGEASDNGYYFAVSLKDNTNDDDVFAGSCIVNEEGTDIFEAINTAVSNSAGTQSGDDESKAVLPESSESEAAEKAAEPAVESPAEELPDEAETTEQTEEELSAEQTDSAEIELPAPAGEESSAQEPELELAA